MHYVQSHNHLTNVPTLDLLTLHFHRCHLEKNELGHVVLLVLLYDVKNDDDDVRDVNGDVNDDVNGDVDDDDEVYLNVPYVFHRRGHFLSMVCRVQI